MSMLLLPRTGERFVPLPESVIGAPGAREALRRIHADYHEMPGLRVTLKQGCRLWNLTPEVCRPILDAMVASGFLNRKGEHYGLRY
jgi:hypothetical protein